MKIAQAFLDIESVKQEQEQNNQRVKDAFWKMHYRGIEHRYVTITLRNKPDLVQWIQDNKISPYEFHVEEQHISLLGYYLKCFPKNWEIEMIAGWLTVMDKEKAMGEEARRNHGFENEMVKIIFFTHDEEKRKGIAEHFIYDPRVQVCATMAEVAASMDIPIEAFDEKTRAFYRDSQSE